MPWDLDCADRDSRRDCDVLLSGDHTSQEAAVRAISRAFADARAAGRKGGELAAVIQLAGSVRVALATRAYFLANRGFSYFSDDVADDDLLVVFVKGRKGQPITGRLSQLEHALKGAEGR